MFFKSPNLQKYIFQKTILNLEFKFPANNSKVLFGGKFKFQAQASFLEYFSFEIWRSVKRIALSEKRLPLTEQETDQAAPDQFTIPLNKFALAASTASVCTSSGVAVAVGATGNSTQSQSRQCSRQSSQVLQRLWSFQL